MTQATLPRPHGAVDAEHQHGLPTRPVEDRSFEAVEITVGVVCGAVVGAVVAGPIGGVIGGVIGAAILFVAAEAVERSQGLASLTTDAQERPRRHG
jgi:uncharacterized membrane protein